MHQERCLQLTEQTVHCVSIAPPWAGLAKLFRSLQQRLVAAKHAAARKSARIGPHRRRQSRRTKLIRMKFVCLVYLESGKLRAVPDRECLACGNAMRTDGVLVAAEALQPVATARTL